MSPKWFFVKIEPLIRVLAWFAGISLTVGLFLGLYASPPDYQQGEAVRIMYIHVPSAILSMSCFACMGVFAAILLIWRIQLAGILLRGAGLVGCLLTGLALITGSLWGRPMWGTFWVWDARLTSELILWLLYIALLAIQSGFQKPAVADKAMAILTLVGMVDLPIIHYSVAWWNTLHQGSSFPLGKKPLIDSAMLWPLGWMFLGLSTLSAWAVLQLARGEIVRRKIVT